LWQPGLQEPWGYSTHLNWTGLVCNYNQQGPRFSTANFAKFHGAIYEIPRCCYPQIPYIPRPVHIVVLTDNTSKYKKFIVTCNTETHYIRQKNGQFRIFPRQAANSTANGEFCGTMWKSTCRRILLALIINQWAVTVYQEQVETTPRTLAPVKTMCTVTMHYFGPNLNLSSNCFADADEVIVDQQPAGCGSISVFREVVQRGSEYNYILLCLYFVYVFTYCGFYYLHYVLTS